MVSNNVGGVVQQHQSGPVGFCQTTRVASSFLRQKLSSAAGGTSYRPHQQSRQHDQRTARYQVDKQVRETYLLDTGGE